MQICILPVTVDSRWTATNAQRLEADEIDSWMFQTVGHDIVSLYGEAMDVPLYRHVIHGTNISQGLSYVPEYGDETEDLYDLLVRVKVRL